MNNPAPNLHISAPLVPEIHEESDEVRFGSFKRGGEVHNREEGEMARKSRQEGEIGATM